MKNMLVSILILLLISTALLLSGCGKADSAADKSGTKAAALDDSQERFILPDIYNKKHRWSQFVGKPFIVNFWATWCGPCRAEIPAMKKIYSEFKSKGLEIVAISVDDARTKARVPQFIDQYKIPWIVLYGGRPVSDEFKSGSSIPVTIFFDAEGNESSRFVGGRPESDFRREVAKLFP